jgi:uncharacterized membrane protein
MNGISRIHKTLFFICLAAILCAALTQAGISLLMAVITPMWFLLATVVGLSILSVDEHLDTQPSPVLPVFSARPPLIY